MVEFRAGERSGIHACCWSAQPRKNRRADGRDSVARDLTNPGPLPPIAPKLSVMAEQQGAERRRSGVPGWWLTLSGVCGGVVLALVAPVVAWGLWYGSSNDGDGPGEPAALAVGVVVPVVLALLVLLVRPWRRLGAGFLGGVACVDVVAWVVAATT